MSHPIIKIRATDYLSVWSFRDKLPFSSGKVVLKFKHKKRWRLRKVWVNCSGYNCEYCGPITEIEVSKGDKVFKFDNHFGPMDVSTVINSLI